jgi:hypothetical protein
LRKVFRHPRTAVNVNTVPLHANAAMAILAVREKRIPRRLALKELGHRASLCV